MSFLIRSMNIGSMRIRSLVPLMALAMTFTNFSMAYAQIEMADNLRSEGKIYIVIAIILTIMIGFFWLLFRLDRKTKRIEKEFSTKENSTKKVSTEKNR